MVSVKISPSDQGTKRYKAIFYENNKKILTKHFGYKGGSTYIDHKDDKIKEAWIARHKVRGDFNNYKSSSALSRWVLWDKTSFNESVKSYKSKFNLS